MTYQRLTRAIERAKREKVRPVRIQEGIYLVPSCSRPGEAYRVTVRRLGKTIEARCECIAGEMRRPCKHAAAILLLEEPGFRYRGYGDKERGKK